jgi:hypothetical protein
LGEVRIPGGSWIRSAEIVFWEGEGQPKDAMVDDLSFGDIRG